MNSCGSLAYYTLMIPIALSLTTIGTDSIEVSPSSRPVTVVGCVFFSSAKHYTRPKVFRLDDLAADKPRVHLDVGHFLYSSLKLLVALITSSLPFSSRIMIEQIFKSTIFGGDDHDQVQYLVEIISEEIDCLTFTRLPNCSAFFLVSRTNGGA